MPNGEKLGLIDYRKLVSNPDIECKVKFNKNGTIDEANTDPMIVRYCELNKEYHFKIDKQYIDIASDVVVNTNVKQKLFFGRVGKEIREELSNFGYADSEISDILVKFLYYIKPSKHKEVLWFSYGCYIVENLKNHFKVNTKTIQCVDCGEWFEVATKDNRTCRCESCHDEYIKKYDNERKEKMSDYTEFKTIICCDCGDEFVVEVTNNRTKRCQECQNKKNKESKLKWWNSNK